MSDDRNTWLDDVLEWVYEFRVLIIALILVSLMLGIHSCEFRLSVDSRPSQTDVQK